MTEAEWLACRDPQKLLMVLIEEKRASTRKSHLFACACVRRIWHLLKDERIRQAVEMGEQLADGKTTEEQVDDTWCSWCDDPAFFRGEDAEVAALAATGVSARWYFDDAQMCAACAATGVETNRLGIEPVSSELAAEWQVQERLLRCIAGNPFRPVRLDPRWITPTVAALAKAAYEERLLPSGYFDDRFLAILGDALEEGGCSNAALLDHLRDQGPHVRGCWPVDLVLGKE